MRRNDMAHKLLRRCEALADERWVIERNADYIRDAQGNVMATYRYQKLPLNPEPGFEASLKLTERPIYGSSRLGVDAHALELGGIGPEDPNPYLLDNPIGKVNYELTDHLGNVSTVITDELIGVDIEDNASAFEYFQPFVVSAQGYEPFGSLLPGRNYRQPTGPPPPPVTPKGSLVITEFSNGPATGTTSGNCEYVELYVTKCALYPEATAVDIRGWIIDDNAGNFNISGGCGMGVAISAGHLIFAQVAAWATVPVGSVIVLYNGADNCYSFTPNESGTGGVYMVNVNSTTLIQRTGSGATPNGSTADCDYCENSYTATADSPSSWGSVFSLGNTADAVQVRCPDCPEAEAGFFHGVGYGTGFGAVASGQNDLGGAYKSGSGSGRTYELTGTECGTLGDAAGWSHSAAPVAGTPPSTVGVVDPGVLAWLENCSVPCCSSFEAPALIAKHGYRFGFNGMEKDDEVYGSEGTSYTAEFWQYDPRLARRWNIDPVDQISISNYAVFGLNPINNVDPNGAWFWESKNVRQGRDFAKATGGIFSKSKGNAFVDVSGIAGWGDGGHAVSYGFRKGQDRSGLLLTAKVDAYDVFSSQKSGMDYLMFNTLERGDAWMKGLGNDGQPPDLIKAIVAINPLVGIPDAISTIGLGEDLWGGDADTYTDKTMAGVGLAIPALKAVRPLVLTGKALGATEKATKVVDAVNSGAQFTNDAGGLDWLKDLEKED